jgi:hypothetical protein
VENEMVRLTGKYPENRSDQSVKVSLPDGRVATFPNQATANAFKRKAGIQ